MTNKNPNATAAGGASSAGIIVVYVAGLCGLDVPPEVAAALVGLLTTVVLAIGRRPSKDTR